MKLELIRLSDNQRFAHCYSGATPNIHGWIQDSIVEEFRPWPTDDVDSIDAGDEGEIITINAEPVAALRFSIERPIPARRAA